MFKLKVLITGFLNHFFFKLKFLFSLALVFLAPQARSQRTPSTSQESLKLHCCRNLPRVLKCLYFLGCGSWLSVCVLGSSVHVHVYFSLLFFLLTFEQQIPMYLCVEMSCCTDMCCSIHIYPLDAASVVLTLQSMIGSSVYLHGKVLIIIRITWFHSY